MTRLATCSRYGYLIRHVERYLFAGETAAVATSFIWAVTALIWSRIGGRVRPLKVILVTGLTAVVVLLVTALLTGGPVRLNWNTAALFFISGTIGIGIGDTCYLQAVNRLGPTRALLLMMTAPVFTTLLGVLFLSEVPGPQRVFGVVVTLTGIGWVVSRRKPTEATEATVPLQQLPAEDASANIGGGESLLMDVATPTNAIATTKRTLSSVRIGVLLGCLGAAMHAVAMIISRRAYALEPAAEPATVTIIRLSAGALLVGILLPLIRAKRFESMPSPPLRIWMWIILAGIVGTAGGTWLMQIAVEHGSNAGVIQTLLSVSPLFVLPMTALAGERVSKQAVLGALLATSGVAILLTAP